ncbi:MAG: response regulator [Acidimicrobiales bacterium]
MNLAESMPASGSTRCTTSSGPGIAEPHLGGVDVVLVDDHPLLSTALRDRLQTEGHSAAVAELRDCAVLISTIVACRPALVVLDLGLPVDGGGLGLIQPLVSAGLKVAVLTGEADRMLWARCSAAGAEVILSKAEPLDEITWSIGRLLCDQSVRPHQRIELADIHRTLQREQAEKQVGFDQLSEREGEILAGLMAGHDARQLAERDVLSIQTIRCHIKSVLAKLGVNSQLAAVARANASGWEPGGNRHGTGLGQSD